MLSFMYSFFIGGDTQIVFTPSLPYRNLWPRELERTTAKLDMCNFSSFSNIRTRLIWCLHDRQAQHLGGIRWMMIISMQNTKRVKEKERHQRCEVEHISTDSYNYTSVVSWQIEEGSRATTANYLLQRMLLISWQTIMFQKHT